MSGELRHQQRWNWPISPGIYQSQRHFFFGFNTWRPRQNGRHFADNVVKCIFLNENVWISLKISLKFVPKGPINNIPLLVQIMAWRRPGDKPLSEPMMVSLLTHICVTWSQWVKEPAFDKDSDLRMIHLWSSYNAPASSPRKYKLVDG